MDTIVQHSRELLDKQGPSAIGFYTSGQLFLEEYYTRPSSRTALSAPTTSTVTPGCARRRLPRR